jgi:AcrR family transcriptional regulator
MKAPTRASATDLSPSGQRRYGGVPPAERLRRRRLKLLEGGLEVFGTKGFHAATVREVCAAARLTERYFYESFKTLHELFLAVYADLRDQLMARELEAIGTDEATPLGTLEPALRVFLEFIRDDPRRGQVMLVDAVGVNAEVTTVSDAAARDYSSLLKERLTRLFPKGRSQDISVALLADGMIGLNVMLAARWMQNGFDEPIDKVVATNLLPYRGLLALVSGDPRV